MTASEALPPPHPLPDQAPAWKPAPARTPARPGGPVDTLVRGGHWRAVLRAAETD